MLHNCFYFAAFPVLMFAYSGYSDLLAVAVVQVAAVFVQYSVQKGLASGSIAEYLRVHLEIPFVEFVAVLESVDSVQIHRHSLAFGPKTGATVVQDQAKRYLVAA